MVTSAGSLKEIEDAHVVSREADVQFLRDVPTFGLKFSIMNKDYES